MLAPKQNQDQMQPRSGHGMRSYYRESEEIHNSDEFNGVVRRTKINLGQFGDENFFKSPSETTKENDISTESRLSERTKERIDLYKRRTGKVDHSTACYFSFSSIVAAIWTAVLIIHLAQSSGSHQVR